MKQIQIILLSVIIFITTDVLSMGSTRLYNEKSLSSSLTTAIAQDRDGFIWIGTEYGLNRYDGITFKAYLHDDDDDTSIKSNIIRSLFKDREGRLWIGYHDGLQAYNAGTDSFMNVSFGGLDKAPSISAIYQLQSGKIWIDASKLGIFEVDVETMSASPVERLEELCGTANFLSVYEDSNNRIWISTSDKGIICVDSDLKDIIGIYFRNETHSYGGQISQNKDNILILSHDRSIYMFDEVHKEFIEMKHPEFNIMAHDFLLRQNGDFIMATSNHGIWKINEQTRTLEEYDVDYPDGLDIGNARIVKIMEDKDGNLWMGSFQHGVIMLPYSDDNSFMQWKLGTPSSVLRSSKGHIWCGTQDGRLIRLDEKGDILSEYQMESEIRCISEDSNGYLWIGLRHTGLFRMDQNTGRRTLIEDFKGKIVTDVVEDNDKTLFISVGGEGIWKYDLKDGRCIQLTDNNTENMEMLRNTNINMLMIDSSEHLWIGHYRGVSRYDIQAERFEDVATDSLLNTSVCYALHEAKDGRILIGSNTGLYQWKETNGNHVYTRSSTKDGLSSDMICGVIEDPEGNIWCSTFRGINCINANDRSITTWHAGNGASKKEYIRSCYHSDGRNIFFGNLTGVTQFKTPINIIEKPYEIQLTGFQIGSSEVPVGSLEDDIRLSHSENTFTLEFSPMTFNGDAIRIHYRLLGLDPSWHVTRYGVNQVTYNNIGSGKYTLEAYSEENGMKSDIRSIQIHIGRPWYRSVAAYIIYTAALMLLVAALYVGRERRERERANAKKLKHYINLAHEIRTPMVMITNPLETLMKNAKDPETASTILTMKRNTDRIVRTLDQFLEVRRLDSGSISIRRRNEDLVKIIENSLKYFTYQAKKKNISLRFEHAMDIMCFSIDAGQIDTVMYNLISNSLKYTPDGGEIIVNLSIDNTNGNAVITVTDSGIGIDEKSIKKIFTRFYQDPSHSAGVKGFGIGLNLCQMLVELHDGKITASNRPERSGAVFTITIPAHDVPEETTLTGNIIKEEVAADENPDNETAKKIKPKKSEKILIVDDDDEIRSYLEEQLSSIYRTTSATNGDMGIQKALTEIPDLIISDIRMPGTDGYQLVKKLKGNSNTTHIPIILLTAKNDLDDKITGLEHGADNYIAKPFHMTELKILIENLLRNRQRVRGKYSGAYQEDKIKPIELESDDEVLMKRIMKVINENLDNADLKVEMLSKEIGLSRVQLHRRMKEITGISTGEFIRNIRLKKAAELLAEKKVNVSQVAYMVGFSSHTHFSTAFRKFYGMSPTEYINKEG